MSWICSIAIFLLAVLSPFGLQSATELSMKNGMKVLFHSKKKSESKQVKVRVIALGGYYAYPRDKRLVARLALKAGVESGLGDFSADQLSSWLYHMGIDYDVKISPFHRHIEAVGDISKLGAIMTLIDMTFKRKNFSEEAFKKVINGKKKGIKEFDSLLNTVFSEEINPPKTSEGSYSVLYEEAQEIFREVFADTKQFAMIIVGNIDERDIFKAARQHFEKLDQVDNAREHSLPFEFIIPRGIQNKYVPRKSGQKNRLVFPYPEVFTPQKFESYKFAIQLIKQRLARSSSDGIIVNYEMPLYPMIDIGWFVVHYEDPSDSSKIVDELRELQAKGPTQSELKEVQAYYRKQKRNSDDFWMETLTLYGLHGWKINEMFLAEEMMETMNLQSAKNALQEVFSLDNYTQIAQEE